jgi:hypothetical protein
MHRWELIQDPHFLKEEYQLDHVEYLKQEHDHPIYMCEKYDEIPSSVRYPIEKLKYLGGKYRTFTSSFCYMMAMAVHEGYKRIDIHGFNMRAETEYEYQRESAVKWIAWAEGTGIDVNLAPTSGLHSEVNLFYGYEGIPMVSRQSIESYNSHFYVEEQKSLAEKHKWEGIISERRKQGASRRKMKEARDYYEGFMRQAAMNEGAAQAMAFLLSECDMIEQEPLLTDDLLIEMQEA